MTHPPVFNGPLLCAQAPGVALLWALPARAGAHIRIILDTSLSMERRSGGKPGNDPRRLAKLATLLFYDLADPNLTESASSSGSAASPRSSFKIYPFAKGTGWTRWSKGGSRPGLKVEAIDPSEGGSSAADHRRYLQQELARLSYDGMLTYFYPGLEQAYEELKDTRGEDRDTRVVVIVTDGLPEDDTKAAELAYIRKNLLGKYRKKNIQLYVLAFGPMAYANSSFFDQLTRPPSGHPLGQNKVDPDGENLLQSMIEIFQWSFGYALVDSGTRPAKRRLNLSGSSTETPSIALVIAYSRARAPPSIGLRSPTGHLDRLLPRHLPQHDRSRGFLGQRVGAKASYAIQKINHPSPQPYSVSGAHGARLAVLQPVNVSLEIKHLPSLKRGLARVPSVMAGEPLDLVVDVTPESGQGHLPSDINLHHEVQYYHTPGMTRHRMTGKPGTSTGGPAPAPGGGGLRFKIRPTFELEPEGTPYYSAFVDVWALRRTATVGEYRRGEKGEVHVYPRLSMVPDPLEKGTRPAGALDRNDRGCASFTFKVTGQGGGKLPGGDGDEFPLVATLDSSLDLGSGPLSGAQLTLDGAPLRQKGDTGPGTGKGSWLGGKPLAEAEIRAAHTVCVKIGKQQRGDPSVRVPVRFVLNVPPYDQFDVAQPFTLIVSVAEPGLLQRMGAWIFFWLFLLGLAALLWFLRNRPDIPSDMCSGVSRRDPRGMLTPPATRNLGEASPLQRWLGLTPSYAVEDETGSMLIGHVKPVDRGLYHFVPASDVQIYRADTLQRGGDRRAVPMESGSVLLEVRRIYLAVTPPGEVYFQVSYQ